MLFLHGCVNHTLGHFIANILRRIFKQEKEQFEMPFLNKY